MDQRSSTTSYRLYTEDIHRDWIVELLNSRFNGFTLIPTIGGWKGATENSLIIELFGVERESVMEAASKIASFNHQDAVAVMAIEASSISYITPAVQVL